MAVSTQKRMGINVGISVPEARKQSPNKQEMQKGYNEQLMITGFRALARGDFLEGRRTDLFMNRVNEFYEDKQSLSQAQRIKRLRNLEKRGIILEAIVDLVPSLFASIWRVIPILRKSR